MSKIFWLFPFLLFAMPNHAVAFTGSELYAACENADQHDYREAMCLAYIRGYADGMAMGIATVTTGKNYCPPKTLDVIQAKLVIQKFMRDYPEALSMEAGALSGMALVQAFPCKKN